MIIYYTKYADTKFDILRRHHVFLTREIIEDIINLPEKTNKIGKYLTAEKDSIKVLYFHENNLIRVVTFYPIKN